MTAYREIRADYDASTIVVYQAYNDAIADAALKAQRFVAPFSMNRMTWIKPSFLWLMERSGWGTKSNQNRILAVRISRAGWDRALSLGVLTSFTPGVHGSVDEWRQQFGSATVHVQWDPERSFHGKKLDHRAIQVGISRTLIEEFVSDWIKEITDLTPLTRKLHSLRKEGKQKNAKRLLPSETPYAVDINTTKRLALTPDP